MSLSSINTSCITVSRTEIVASSPKNPSSGPPKRTWSQRTSSGSSVESSDDLDFEQQKMMEVLEQAVKDHGLNLAELPINPSSQTEDPLHTSFTQISKKGKRDFNEDEYAIYQPEEDYDFFAIFDGHGLLSKDELKQPGQIVASLAADFFNDFFFKTLKECDYNMPLTFNVWCDMTHDKIPEIAGGSTAVLCCADKVNNLLYVATLGDSEAVLIREKGNALFAIPLSPAMHWCTPAAEERAKNVMLPSIFEKWVKTTEPKKRRFPPPPPKGVTPHTDISLNVAAALGDKLALTRDGKTAITHEPLCSMTALQEGDLVIAACDGVFDVVSLPELVSVIQSHWRDPDADMAKHISTYALKDKQSLDNVTVIAMQINPEARQFEEESTQEIDEGVLQ